MASKGGGEAELARELLGKIVKVPLARELLQMGFTIERVSIIEHTADVKIVWDEELLWCPIWVHTIGPQDW